MIMILAKEQLANLRIPQKRVENFSIDSFYCFLYAIRYQLKNKKNECQNDNELKIDSDNNKLYDVLSTIKEKDLIWMF